MLKSGENGLIGPGSNDYGRSENKMVNNQKKLIKTVTEEALKKFENSRILVKAELDAIDSQILDLKHQLGQCNADRSTSLEGCPFMYCDSNSKCKYKCRYI